MIREYFLKWGRRGAKRADWRIQGRRGGLSSSLAPVISVKEKIKPPAENQGVTELAGPLRKVVKGLKQLVWRTEMEEMRNTCGPS